MTNSEPTAGSAEPSSTMVDSRYRKGLLVLNPVGGKGEPEEVRLTIHTSLAGLPCDVYEISGEEKLSNVVAKAVKEHDYLWVAAIGGDGTVSEVANGLIGTKIPLAIIQTGTGNALAHELGIPQNIDKACQLLLGETDTRTIDLIQVDDNFSLLQVGIGLESVTLKNTSPGQKNRWGKIAYIWNAVRKVFGWQPFRFRLTVDGYTHELKASEIIIANAAAVGILDLDWHRAIKPDDGRIEVITISARSISDYVRIIWALLRRQQHRQERMRIIPVRDSMQIKMEQPFPVHLDGEVLDERTELAANVVPSAVTIMVPGDEAPEDDTGDETDVGSKEEPTTMDHLRHLAIQPFKEWQADKASRLAASLSYYTVFSLPPLLVLSLAIAGLLYDRELAQEQLLAQTSDLLGDAGSKAFVQILENASNPTLGSAASIISIILLFLGASGVFTQLQEAMNTIWEVRPKPGRGILGTVKARVFSFGMVLSVGFLLLVSLVVSTALAALNEYLTGLAPETIWLVRIASFFISFSGIAFMFALIFKVIPDVRIQWRDVWLGAVVTALLFNLGKWAIGIYLGRSATASTYGAAGSLIVALLWVYYSAQILFLGAEFTQVYAGRFGRKIVPDDDAVQVNRLAR